MKLRLVLSLALASAAVLAAAPAEASPRGKDRREVQRSHHRDDARGDRHEGRRHDARPNRAERRGHGDRFDRARRTIRNRTVERGAECPPPRSRHRVTHHQRRYDSRPRVTFEFRTGSAYCPPPRRVVQKTVVVERPVVRRRVVTHERPVVVERRVVVERPTYVEYSGHAWDDLERGYHRAALDSFGILASSQPHEALPKIGYGLSAAGLRDDTVAAAALRRALRADADEVRRFRATPRLSNMLRDLERRYERSARANPYDQDAVFLLATVRTLRGDAITSDALENELQMLSSEDRELLGIGVAEPAGVGMYDE